MSARCGHPHLRGTTSRVQNPKLPARGTLRRRAFDQLTALHSRIYRASGGGIGSRYRYGSRMLLGIWPQLIETNPTWDDYARRTDRDVPVVFLTPAG